MKEKFQSKKKTIEELEKDMETADNVRSISAAAESLADIAIMNPETPEAEKAIQVIIDSLGKKCCNFTLFDPDDNIGICGFKIERRFSDKISKALRRIGKPVVQPLISSIEQKRNINMARALCAEVLGEMGELSALPAILNLLDPYDYNHYIIVTGSIGFIFEKNQGRMEVLDSIPFILDSIAYGESMECAAQAVAKAGEPAIPILMQKLMTCNDMATLTAAHALGKMGSISEETLLHAVVKSSGNLFSQIFAGYALGIMGEPALEKIAKLFSNDEVCDSAMDAFYKALDQVNADKNSRKESVATSKSKLDEREDKSRHLKKKTSSPKVKEKSKKRRKTARLRNK